MTAVRRVIYLLVILCCSTCAFAQDDFCNAVHTILADAPNRFKNIEDSTINANPDVISWTSKVSVPGAIKERFLNKMGLFYQGAMFQTKNVGELKDVYEDLKSRLNACLRAEGYKVTVGDNFYKDAAAYRKLVYMKPFAPTDKSKLPPAHVSVEVDWRRDTGEYTLLLYIWEH